MKAMVDKIIIRFSTQTLHADLAVGVLLERTLITGVQIIALIAANN